MHTSPPLHARTCTPRLTAQLHNRSHGSIADHRQRPCRTVIRLSAGPARAAGRYPVATGTPTAFDPIIGAAQARAAYGVDGTGHDRRGDRHRGRLQQSGAGRRLRPRGQGDRGLQLRQQHGRSSGDHLAARHGRRRADRLERPQSSGRRPGRQHRGPQGGGRQQLGRTSSNDRPGPPVGHRQPRQVQHHRRQHVAVRRRQLCPELVRAGRRRGPADHRA